MVVIEELNQCTVIKWRTYDKSLKFIPVIGNFAALKTTNYVISRDNLHSLQG